MQGLDGEMSREEAIEAAARLEAQFFRWNDTYRHSDNDDLFRYSAFMMHEHLTSPLTYVFSDEFSDALFASAHMKIWARYLLSKLKDGEQLTIELPWDHRQSYVDKGTRLYTKTVIIRPIFRGDGWVRLLFLMPLTLEDSHQPAYALFSNKLKGGLDERAIHKIFIFTDLAPIDHDINLSESVQKLGTSEVSHEFMVKVLKALLYIKSDGNPDLRSERPLREIVTLNPKKAKKQLLDLTHFPLVRVGWDFKKTPIYQKGQWRTYGHYRWQWYGSREQPAYRLQWIKEHLKERRANKDEQIEEDNE